MAEGLVRGGISRAVAEAFQGTRITSVEASFLYLLPKSCVSSNLCEACTSVVLQAQKTVVCPRPRLPSLRRVCSTEHMIEDDAVVPSKCVVFTLLLCVLSFAVERPWARRRC